MTIDSDNQGPSGRVFISHSGEDADETRRIVDHLRAEGIDPWVDFDHLDRDALSHHLASALHDARAVLLVWSPQAARSEWVAREVEEANRLANEPGGGPALLVVPGAPPSRALRMGQWQAVATLADGRVDLDDLAFRLRRLGRPEPYSRVLAHDLDQPVFGTAQCPDVHSLWGRLCHHLLLFGEVVVTDSAAVTNRGFLELARRGDLAPLVEAGALRVAVRSGLGEAPLVALHRSDGEPDLAPAVRRLEGILGAVRGGVLPFDGPEVARQYTERVAEFFEAHRSSGYTALGGDSALVAQLEAVRDYGLEKCAGKTALRLAYFPWHSNHARKLGDPPVALRSITGPVKALVEAGLNAPYRLNVPTHLGLESWMPPEATREALDGNALSTLRQALGLAEREARPIDLEVSPRLGWLLRPTPPVYAVLGQVVHSPEVLMGLRTGAPRLARTRRGALDLYSLAELEAHLRRRLAANLSSVEKLFAQGGRAVFAAVGEDVFQADLDPNVVAAAARRDPGALQVLTEARVLHSTQVELPGEARARLAVDDWKGRGAAAARLERLLDAPGDGRPEVAMEGANAPTIHCEHDSD